MRAGPLCFHERLYPETKKRRENLIHMLLDQIEVTNDKIKLAHDAFSALCNTFPLIAQHLIRSELNEHETAAKLRWHVKSLRTVLLDFRWILRRGGIRSIDEWRGLLHERAA